MPRVNKHVSVVKVLGAIFSEGNWGLQDADGGKGGMGNRGNWGNIKESWIYLDRGQMVHMPGLEGIISTKCEIEKI